MNINKKSRLARIGIYSFYVIILFDFITKILLTYNIETFNRYSLIPKLIINVVLLLTIIKTFSYKKHKFVLYYFIIFLLSLFAFLHLHRDFNLEVIYKQVYTLLLYSYPFILVVYINSLNPDTKKAIVLALEKPILNVGVICCVLIFIGLLTKIELFRSYDFSKRFGFNGIFLKTSEASYYFIMLIMLSYCNYIKQYKSIIFLLIFLIFSLLIGTKVVWLFILLSLYTFFLVKHRKGTLVVSFLLVISYFLFRNPIDAILIKQLPYGELLYNENGMITVLTSTRDLLLEKLISYTNENWSIINYLFGGNKYWFLKVEFEFVDLLSLFGLIGFALFYFFIKTFFIKKSQHNLSRYFVIAILICAFFAGNFFKSFLGFTVFYFTYELINIKTKTGNFS